MRPIVLGWQCRLWGPTTGVKTPKAQYQQMHFRFAPDRRPIELLPPPAFCERRHRSVARRRGSMPYWRIVFSTFRECMSFYTARVIHDQCGRSHASMFVRCCPKADFPILELTPAANSWRTPPSRPRVSPRSHASVCGRGPHGGRKRVVHIPGEPTGAASGASRLRHLRLPPGFEPQCLQHFERGARLYAHRQTHVRDTAILSLLGGRGCFMRDHTPILR